MNTSCQDGKGASVGAVVVTGDCSTAGVNRCKVIAGM
jgi:hypothetical protein